MMKQVITIQLIITLSASIVLWLVLGESVGRSYFWAGLSITLPNVFVVFLSFLIKSKQAIFWLGAFVNKFISALLLAGSVLYLKDPNWVAFLAAIVVTVFLPMVITGFGYKYLKHDM
nr:hypothetical protein [Wohlfahrtiimonas chitiniclastica]